eukprot:jgi/Picre1/33441/NNA_008765.t1
MCVGVGTAPEKLDFRTLNNGVYRLRLCAIWPRCLDFEEYIGFRNKTCSKKYGPILRDFSDSRNWKSWKLELSNKTQSSAQVTIQMHYPKKPQPRCEDAYITPAKSELYLSQKDRETFSLRLADEYDCVNIVHENRVFAASQDCNDLRVGLAKPDPDSDLQRWRLIKVA